MADIQKISIVLTSEQVNSLKAAVETGEYATTSEIVREALREWQWKRELRGEDLKRMREIWSKGKSSGAATPLDMDKTRNQARQRLRKATERRA